MREQLLIFDADGVFLDERVYWETALRVALSLNGVATPKGRDWAKLLRAALDTVGLQRVTKSRGCNSNWDLCAVLGQALCDQNVRNELREQMANRSWVDASETLWSAADNLWQDPFADGTRDPDPLAGFEIDRSGDKYRRAQAEFQRTLGDAARRKSPDWAGRLLGSKGVIRDAFRSFRGAGFELAVCTGRNQQELVEPLRAFGLAQFFDPNRLITEKQIIHAQCELNVKHLGKPHWFPLACAILGQSNARDLVRMERTNPIGARRAIYVGDAPADFRSVEGARSVGLSVDYVHVRSGSTDASHDKAIASAEFTLGIVDDLASAASLVRSNPARAAT